MKKVLFALLFLLLGAVSVFADCTASLFAGGNGTQANPYQIATPEQLQNLNQCLGSTYTSNYYVITQDIDLTDYLSVSGAGYNDGQGWLPIGYYTSGNNNRFMDISMERGTRLQVFGLAVPQQIM
ncbi:hypothetical protein AGMMS49938_11390 [Fibrobacterales bacterium]|nr:hypothetical protein AGMMS49938_11390 [Fibrobacterales bacterium]